VRHTVHTHPQALQRELLERRIRIAAARTSVS
jgi:hypothetical protein